MTTTAGLVLSHVSHHFGVTKVVDDVSLSVGPGEFVCLLGPSGCGKTTTLRIAAGLEAPTAGTVTLNGTLVSAPGVQVPPERRQVGFLFQDYALFPHLKVGTNVAFGIAHMAAEPRRARVTAMLEQVGMAAYAEAWPHQLSGGQQQRVALARALAPNPGLMLLDEPFSGLDKRLRDQIRDETLHVLKRNRVATVMVTHDPEEAMFMADRIAVMRQGRIVQCDRPHTLYDHPIDPFVLSFFGEVNRLEAPSDGTRVRTALGDFASPHHGPVQVLVRPEAFLAAHDGAFAATVVEVRPLGRSNLMRLRLPDSAAPVLQVRLAGSEELPAEGASWRFAIDPAQVFVFPKP